MAKIIKPRFNSHQDEFNKALNKRPVYFDIIHPDGVTSLLGDLRLVCHVNPTQLSFSYQKKVSRSPTIGGWIEYYWGDEPYTITLDMSTGGFIRVFSGLSNTTGPVNSLQQERNATVGMPSQSTYGIDLGGNRRQTLAYDKYLDLLSLFHNNGSIYDSRGYVTLQGRIQMNFDGGQWYGWFQSFSVSETADSPFAFKLNMVFQVEREVHGVRTQGGDFR
jgi:hypothetical protein